MINVTETKTCWKWGRTMLRLLTPECQRTTGVVRQTPQPPNFQFTYWFLILYCKTNQSKKKKNQVREMGDCDGDGRAVSRPTTG